MLRKVSETGIRTVGFAEECQEGSPVVLCADGSSVMRADEDVDSDDFQTYKLLIECVESLWTVYQSLRDYDIQHQ